MKTVYTGPGERFPGGVSGARMAGRMRKAFRSAAALLAGLVVKVAACAQPIAVPNGSFESPPTAFVSTVVEAWKKMPRPEWYEEGGGFLWDQLVGIFRNTPVSSADHIENCDGLQAAWLFAVPEVGMYQVLGQSPGTVKPPPVFTPGHAYELVVGVLGGGGNMAAGATLELALFYEDDAGRVQPVARTVVTNEPGVFGSPKLFLDYRVRTPVVQEADPWAGRPIGVRFLSTVNFDLQGGYWDLDHVRLVARSAASPRLEPPRFENGRWLLTVQGEPAAAVELLSGPDLTTPVSAWPVVERQPDFNGSATFSVEALDGARRFFAARLVLE